MLSLRELQRGFAQAILDPQVATRFESQIRAAGLDGTRRVQIYRNNRNETLTQALADVYPVIKRLVGEAFFRQVARSYIDAHAATTGDIHHYGARFGHFLATLPQTTEHLYLCDVARLEWAYHAVFHAEAYPAMDVRALQTVAQADYPWLRFGFQPAARLLQSACPVLRIWQVNQPDWPHEPTVNLAEGGVSLLVIRNGAGVEFRPLAAGEYVFLQSLADGGVLSDAQTKAAQADPVFDLALALRRHIGNATLVTWHV
ncbi:MAG: putative DNA-binding domain-containing protein [Candidatus Competibacteraceae bacterium]|nr:putative DNA-binding domain-containing protein [Candidatus Competibacteraceae bacterium]MCB1812640.1 putative DNA-binding domain-containing protein [Candidatus Competibacteraceae bacterium]